MDRWMDDRYSYFAGPCDLDGTVVLLASFDFEGRP